MIDRQEKLPFAQIQVTIQTFPIHPSSRRKHRIQIYAIHISRRILRRTTSPSIIKAPESRHGLYEQVPQCEIPASTRAERTPQLATSRSATPNPIDKPTHALRSDLQHLIVAATPTQLGYALPHLIPPNYSRDHPKLEPDPSPYSTSV